MRPTVSVMWPDGAAATVRHLLPGQHLWFGECRCGRCRTDLVVSASWNGPVTGRIHARRDHWRLDNLGIPAITITDLEYPAHQLAATSGRAGLVVPFELARVYVGERLLATVFGPEPTVRPLSAPCPAMPPGRHSSDLDQHTTYFAVLVALCEPRLRPVTSDGAYPVAAPLPTSAEIARSLRRAGRPVTTAAVDRQIDYLVTKLELRPREPGARARRGWRKEALVAAALRRGLVTTDHLTGSKSEDPAGSSSGTSATSASWPRPRTRIRAGRAPPLPPTSPGAGVVPGPRRAGDSRLVRPGQGR